MASLNKVMLMGRLTKDPEMRYTPSGQPVTSFSIATNRYSSGADGERKEFTDYHNIVAWNIGKRNLAQQVADYLRKGSLVYVEGRLQTRSWDDEKGARHWKTEIVASHVEMLSGRRKKDYEAQQAADSLVAQAEALGEAPATEPIAEASFDPGTTDEDEDDAEGDSLEGGTEVAA